MPDDPLRELLSSPLEKPVKESTRPAGPISPEVGPEQRPPFDRRWLWFLGALVLSAAVVLIGYSLGTEDPVAAAPTTTAPPTTTSTTLPDSPFPEGYTEVDDRLAMRVERVLVRPDSTIVTLSTVTARGLDSEDSAGFPGGLWALVLGDGRRVISADEAADAAAQGFISVVFPSEGFTADDVASIELVGTASSLAEVITTTAAKPVTLNEDGSPVVIPLEPNVFSLDAGLDLQLSDLELSPTGGTLSWSLEGTDTEAVASVVPYLVLRTESSEEILADTRTDTGSFRLFLTFFGISAQSRSGTVIFDVPAGEDPFPTDQPLAVSFDVEAAWKVFNPTSIAIAIPETRVAAVG